MERGRLIGHMPLSSSRVSWIDHLRGFLILLVVAHHSALAYTTFARFEPGAYILSTHPVVDTVRSVLLDYFEDLNDIYFMSLLFLVSGIFALRQLEVRGKRAFLRSRFFRLFVPFLIGVTVLMPVAYYPAWLEAHGKGGMGGFLVDYFTVEGWPVGPPWFLWVLFAFNLLLVWIYPSIKAFMQWAGDTLPKVRTGMELLLLAYIITWVLYVPLMLCAGPDKWVGIGPFDVQVSRVLLYFGYFLLGVIIGQKVVGEEGIFSGAAVFMRKWKIWVWGALLTYAVLKLSVVPLKWMVEHGVCAPERAQWLYRSIWSLCCATCCMACLSLFSRFSRRSWRFWDVLGKHAFNIYLLHYIFVIWCQWLMLGVGWPAPVKFFVCFLVSVVCAWGASWGIGWVKGLIGRSGGSERRFAGFFR